MVCTLKAHSSHCAGTGTMMKRAENPLILINFSSHLICSLRLKPGTHLASCSASSNMVTLLTLTSTALVGYLVWATVASQFFHQVWSISLVSFLLLLNAAIRQQSQLESCALWILTILVGAFCIALSPLQVFIFKLDSTYLDSRLPDTWEPYDGEEDAENTDRPPISVEYVFNDEALRVTGAHN